jgi:phosphate transport system protein
MRDTYHDHLDAVVNDLFEMSRLVARAVAQATAALVNADLSTSEQVISGDEAVNTLYRGVETQAYDLMARQQPVAGDLRVLVTSLRIVVDLERAGDYAVHLAKIARRRYPASAVPSELRDTFLSMGRTAEEIVRKAGDVIASRDVVLASELEGDDDTMDDLQRQLFTQVLQGDTNDIEAAIDATLAGRYYERLADHAVAVGRRVTYMVTGEHADVS